VLCYFVVCLANKYVSACGRLLLKGNMQNVANICDNNWRLQLKLTISLQNIEIEIKMPMCLEIETRQ